MTDQDEKLMKNAMRQHENLYTLKQAYIPDRLPILRSEILHSAFRIL